MSRYTILLANRQRRAKAALSWKPPLTACSLDMVWAKAVAQPGGETGLNCSPDACPWAMEAEALNEGWFPA
jgi:hypothetical protein